MRIKTPFASVDLVAEEAIFKAKSAPPNLTRSDAAKPKLATKLNRAAAKTTSRILWASHPLVTPTGQFLGVRLQNSSLTVALLRIAGRELEWVVPENYLTKRQVECWLKMARFS